MVPRFKPQYRWEERFAALRVWSRGNVSKYEEEFAEKFECKYGVMFAHGRTGIYALMKVWNLRDAEVICPAYTCVVVPNAIVLSGNRPVFVDCAESDFNMDLEKVKESISEKTRVVIATHLFGYSMDVASLEEIVRAAEKKFQHRIYIIQDCAHSYGSRFKGELVTRFGDAAIFGSNISKIINSIFGGMVITSEPELAERLRVWSEKNTYSRGWKKEIKRLLYFVAVNIAFNKQVYGLVNWLERQGFLDRFVKYYDEAKIDFPPDWDTRPAEIEARVGRCQLRKYDRIVASRRKRAKLVAEELRGREDLVIPPFDEEATYSHIVAEVEDRQRWVDEYLQRGEQLGILIEYSIPEMKAYQQYRRQPTPKSDRLANRMINFPVYSRDERF